MTECLFYGLHGIHHSAVPQDYQRPPLNLYNAGAAATQFQKNSDAKHLFNGYRMNQGGSNLANIPAGP